MSPEEQEARSHRYAYGVWCVGLSTGRIAVWTHPTGTFVGIYDDFQSVPVPDRAAVPRKAVPASAPDPDALALLEELGLV